MGVGPGLARDSNESVKSARKMFADGWLSVGMCGEQRLAIGIVPPGAAAAASASREFIQD